MTTAAIRTALLALVPAPDAAEDLLDLWNDAAEDALTYSQRDKLDRLCQDYRYGKPSALDVRAHLIAVMTPKRSKKS